MMTEQHRNKQFSRETRATTENAFPAGGWAKRIESLSPQGFHEARAHFSILQN